MRIVLLPHELDALLRERDGVFLPEKYEGGIVTGVWCDVAPLRLAVKRAVAAMGRV